MPQVTKAEATDAQRADFLEAANDTKTGLRAAMAVLRGRQIQSSDPDEANVIRVALLDLDAELAKVQADLTAFLAELRAVNPPTPQDVREIQGVVREIDRMTANAVVASEVLMATTALVNRWRAIA